MIEMIEKRLFDGFDDSLDCVENVEIGLEDTLVFEMLQT